MTKPDTQPKIQTSIKAQAENSATTGVNELDSQPKILTSFKAKAINSETTGVRKDDIYKVPPEVLEEEPGFNERDYEDPDVVAKIKDFAAAYAAGRFVPPLVARVDTATGRIFVVEGHQRRRGALLAIKEGAVIPVLQCIPFRGNNMDRILCQLSSQDGLKLKPVGIARNYLKLVNMGATEKEIAASRNMTVTHVKGMLTLAEAPVEVQKMVNDGTVSATLAIDMVRKYGENAAEHLKGELAEAKSKGQTKIKPAAMREWIPPRKNSIAIYSSLGTLVETVKKQSDVTEMLQKCADQPEAVAGTSVQVDAAVLIQLLKAFEDAEAIKAKRTSTKAEPEEGAETFNEEQATEA